MMSDRADWAYWDDQLDLNGTIDQSDPTRVQGVPDTTQTVSSRQDQPPSDLSTTLRVCNSNSQSETYRDLGDASLNSRDRSKSQGSKAFLQQVYELRNAFVCNDRPTPHEICQIAAGTGLRDFEVSMWFQTERDLHTEWRKLGPGIVDSLNRSPGRVSRTPNFLEQVHALRESFRENLMCTKPQLLLASQSLDFQEFEVSLWFASERCIQLDLMMPDVGVMQEPASTYRSVTDAHFQASWIGMEFGVEENSPSSFESFHQESMNTSLSEMNISPLASVLGKQAISTRPDSDHTTDAPAAKRRKQFGVEENNPSSFESFHKESMSMSPSEMNISPLASVLSKQAISTRLDSEHIMDAPAPKYRKKCNVQAIFECLFNGCGSKTTSISRWRDHQSRKHFPRQIWICWMNKSDGSLCQHGLVLRADNFMTHLVKEHNQPRSHSPLELVRSKSQRVTNMFHDRCGFCKVFLNSWDESMKHIGAHLCCGIDPSQWDHCCSSSHNLQKDVNNEIIDLPLSLTPDSACYPGYSIPLDPVYRDLFYICPGTIVTHQIKERTQVPSVDAFSDVQNNSAYSFRLRGPLSEEQRRSAALVRRIGACVPCRVRKLKCGPGDICQRCSRAYKPLPCLRYKISDTQLYAIRNFTEESWLKTLLNDEFASMWRRSGKGHIIRRKSARPLAHPFPPYEHFSWWHRLSTIFFQFCLQFALVFTPQGLAIKIGVYPTIYNFFSNQKFRIVSTTFQAITVTPVIL